MIAIAETSFASSIWRSVSGEFKMIRWCYANTTSDKLPNDNLVKQLPLSLMMITVQRYGSLRYDMLLSQLGTFSELFAKMSLWANPSLFLFIFYLFKCKFYRKILGFNGIWTRIVRIEDEHADHLIIATMSLELLFLTGEPNVEN